jgi:hypothetical protein
MLDELGPFDVASPWSRRSAQRLPEFFVEIQRDDRLGEVVEIAAQDVGGIVNCVAVPD